MTSPKKKMDWSSLPSETPVKKAKPDDVYSTIYGCRMQGGKGDLSGKYKWKIYCRTLVKNPEAFLTSLNQKLLIGEAKWVDAYTPGTEQTLMIDVFSIPHMRVVEAIVIDLLKNESDSEKSVTIASPKPVSQDKGHMPPDKIDLTLDTVGEREMYLKGPSIYLKDLLAKLEGEWDREAKAVKFMLTEELTKEYIQESLVELCILTGYNLLCAWYKEPCCVPTLHLHSDPHNPDMLSLTELMHLEQQQAEETYHNMMTQAWHQTKQELEYLEWYHEKPILSVLRAVKAFQDMGASREERKIDMCNLLSDAMYWEKWCVHSEWLII